LGPFTDPPPGLPEDESGATYVFADTDDDLRRAIADADIVFGWNYFSDPGMLRQALPHARSLSWIQTAGVGIERLLFPELVESDIILTNGAGVYESTLAEYAVMLMLLFAKDVVTTIDDQRAHRWRFRGPKNDTLLGRTLLVVGAGGIGRAIGRYGRALGMRSIGVARTARSGEPDFEAIHSLAELPRLIPSTDYLVLIVPLTAETRGMIGADVLREMKPTAHLINLGRGELVDEAALLAALRDREIAGAALDVFSKEPLPGDSPLWDTEHVVVSPHIAGDTSNTPERFVEIFLDNLDRWIHGRALMNVVDKELGWAPVDGTADPGDDSGT
jgi:phosphoglycerate dehydrogenase-like enzyme